MEMTEQSIRITDRQLKLSEVQILLRNLAINYNIPATQLHGFVYSPLGKGEVIVASPYFAIRIKGIENDIGVEDAVFYNYSLQGFTEYTYPMAPNDIFPAAESQFTMTHGAEFAVNDLLNRVLMVSKNTSLKQTRVIISPGYIEPDDAVLRFRRNENNEMQSELNGKVIIQSEDSLNPPQLTLPGEPYRCVPVDMYDGKIEVNVMESYSDLRLGIHVSNAGFFPSMLEPANRMLGVINPINIITSKTYRDGLDKKPLGGRKDPIHLDTTLLYDVVFTMSSVASRMSFFFGRTFNEPVKIMASNGHTQFEAMVATRDVTYGAQRG